MENHLKLPSPKAIVAEYSASAKKSLGQNFLFDLNITRKVASFADILADSHVIEIGPGPGGLTHALLESKAQKVTAIETDDRFVHALTPFSQHPENRFELIHADALKVDLTKLSDLPKIICANLPFNVATKLIINWLSYDEPIQTIVLTLQKEVAERITAKPNHKNYGRLSVLCQWCASCEIAWQIPAKAFVPAPKVDASVVKMLPYSYAQRGKDIDLKHLAEVTQAAFSQRRKTIRKSLSVLFGADFEMVAEKLNLNPKLRAENITVEQYADLAFIWQQKKLSAL